jgi:hypothetical protein
LRLRSVRKRYEQVVVDKVLNAAGGLVRQGTTSAHARKIL